MAKSRPIIVNTAITPAYWGSLLAVIVGMVTLTIATIRSGPPPHVVSAANPYAEPIFYLTIAIILLFTLRYYSALSINIYGGSPASVYRLSPVPRKVMFCLLCLVFMCVSAAGTIASVGIVTALYLCLFTAVTSFLCWGGLWLLSYEARRKHLKPRTAFGFGDVFLVLFMWVATHTTPTGATGQTVTVFAVIVFAIAFGMIHEFVRVFLPEFRKQLTTLIEVLDRP